MKNRVNLYHPEFHPKLRLLTLSLTIVCWLLAITLCVLGYFYLSNKQQHAQSELIAIEQNNQQQRMLVDELQTGLDNRKANPKLVSNIEELQQLIRLRKRVINELLEQKKLQSSGFSQLMLDFAEQHQTGLWLTHVNLNGSSVSIEGATVDSAIIPIWVKSLGKTLYFKGQEFSDTHLYRDDEQLLNFLLTTNEAITSKEEIANE